MYPRLIFSASVGLALYRLWFAFEPHQRPKARAAGASATVRELNWPPSPCSVADDGAVETEAMRRMRRKAATIYPNLKPTI